MVIEFARALAGVRDANSAEFEPSTPNPVISTMADQEHVVAGEGDMGATMRLGAYPASLVQGSLVAEAYGGLRASERHRHRYEVNNAYRERLTDAGLRVSGTSPDAALVEFVELPRETHPFYVGTQAHPELKSRPSRSHPLFTAFAGAALEYLGAERLPVELSDRGVGGRHHEAAYAGSWAG
jgi:CTP synthase